MAKKNNITVFGIKGVVATLAAKNFVTNIKAQKGIKDATLFIKAEVVQSIKGRRAEPTSVDTGRFMEESLAVKLAQLNEEIKKELKKEIKEIIIKDQLPQLLKQKPYFRDGRPVIPFQRPTHVIQRLLYWKL